MEPWAIGFWPRILRSQKECISRVDTPGEHSFKFATWGQYKDDGGAAILLRSAPACTVKYVSELSHLFFKNGRFFFFDVLFLLGFAKSTVLTISPWRDAVCQNSIKLARKVKQ